MTQGQEEEYGRPWWLDLPGKPIDSLAELKRFDIDPRFVHSCSAPDGNTNAGCPAWNQCDMHFKGRRPHNGAIEILKANGRSRRVISDCFGFVLARESVADIGGDVEWIADEGETVAVDETKKLPDPVTAGGFIHEITAVERVVPVFQQLKERPETQHLLRLEEKRARRAAEKRDKKRDRLMGVKDDEGDEQAEAIAADFGAQAERPRIGRGTRGPRGTGSGASDAG